MRVSVITDVLLYEGMVGALLFSFLLFYLKSRDHLSAYVITALAWFTTWIFRQLTVSIITQYKKNHNIPVKHFYLNIPFIN